MATKIEHGRENLKKINESNKEIVFDLLTQLGIEKVTISFDGGGDDGQVYENVYHPETKSNYKKVSELTCVEGAKINQGTNWDPNTKTSRIMWKENPSLSELIQQICYDMLEDRFGGWENDDGSYGEFVLDVKKRTVFLDFNQRYTESKLHKYKF